ncbi:MAG: hypothetical protein M3O06_07000 [Pseudomonadota bacterium]|nr:hypothetical protein [Pseudomonadota bacterium]
MSTPADPIRLFVTHAWAESEDYTRVFEYLESSGTFYYQNTSRTQAGRTADLGAQREDLRAQIRAAEVLIVVPAAYDASPELVLFQLNFAKSADKPIVAMESFGAAVPMPAAISEFADERCGWNERDLIDALRRQARHQESTRWDPVEFKLE